MREFMALVMVMATGCGSSTVVHPLLVADGAPSSDAAGDADRGWCIPGASVACVGSSGCAGGQVCTADGTGYGACDCGGLDAGIADGATAETAGSEAAVPGDAGAQTDVAPTQDDAAPQSDAETNCPGNDSATCPDCFEGHCYLPGYCNTSAECPMQATGSYAGVRVCDPVLNFCYCGTTDWTGICRPQERCVQYNAGIAVCQPR